jgi:hypothetical protein
LLTLAETGLMAEDDFEVVFVVARIPLVSGSVDDTVAARNLTDMDQGASDVFVVNDDLISCFNGSVDCEGRVM